MRSTQPLIFEISQKGRMGVSLPKLDTPTYALPQKHLRQSEPQLPEVSELDVVRHYIALSRRNHGVDNGFYPLGSCTMKYNPRINEDMANLNGFLDIHPLQETETVQGALEVLHRMDGYLSEITGMDAFTLQPAAGAHGELTGLMMIRAYHASRGESHRNQIIVPDSAHGTNPASATMAGFEVLQVESAQDGGVDIEALRNLVGPQTAGLMLTNPNTLGLFETRIKEMADIVHGAGGLMYYDGANLNAILGIARPGDMGFDVVHLNLHKTFATPHGGGGPGSGPVGVKANLATFLPVPVVVVQDGKYNFDENRPQSIGRIRSFYGNFGVIVKALSYILSLGGEGLREAGETAVLNANYLLHKLKGHFDVPYAKACMHEFVLSCASFAENGVHAVDIAKKIIDFAMHPPTMYFPMIVHEALMIEPTETESLETMDHFAKIMIEIAQMAKAQPEELLSAPKNMPVGRPDDVLAARKPCVRWQKGE